MTVARNFHEGEVRIQSESGVDTETFDRMVEQGFQPEMSDSEIRFVGQRTFAVAGSIDGSGRPWGSALVGSTGELFEVLDATTIDIFPTPVDGDPLLENIADNSDIGVLFIDPSLRRRAKSLGHGTIGAEGGVTYSLSRFYGLCTKYIFKRSQQVSADRASTPHDAARTGAGLDADDRSQLGAADTVFLVSHHTEHGTDPTHRGGPPGFVTVIDDTTITIPDYLGNGMFQTIGNLLLDDRIGLLSVDFDTGRAIQLTGRGSIQPSPDVDVYSTRTLRIDIDEVRTTWPDVGEWTDIEAFDLRPGLRNPATPYL